MRWVLLKCEPKEVSTMKKNTRKLLMGLFLAFLLVCPFVPIFVTEQPIVEDCRPTIGLGVLIVLLPTILLVRGSVSLFILEYSPKESYRPTIGIGGL